MTVAVYLERGSTRIFACAVGWKSAPTEGAVARQCEAVRRSAWHWLDHAWEIEDRSAVRDAR